MYLRRRGILAQKKKRRKVDRYRRLSGIAILLSYTHVGKQKRKKEANSTETQEAHFLPSCGLLTVGVAICC